MLRMPSKFFRLNMKEVISMVRSVEGDALWYGRYQQMHNVIDSYVYSAWSCYVQEVKDQKTSPGGQIDASIVVQYATAIFLDCFGRSSAVFQEC